MPRAMNAVERSWVGAVRDTPCVVCIHVGTVQTAHTEAHHVKVDAKTSQRAPHALVAAICSHHHRGPLGLHGLGTRGFQARYRLSELGCLALTIEAVHARLLRHGRL